MAHLLSVLVLLCLVAGFQQQKFVLATVTSVNILSPPTQITSGQTFLVRVSMEKPDAGDIVGLYAVPANTSLSTIPSDQTAIKYYFPAAIDAAYMTANTTTFNISLPNYRTSTVLVLFRGATLNGTRGGHLLPQFAVAYSQVIVNSNPNEFTQAHLGIASITTTSVSVAVQFTTRDKLTPRVLWGLAANQLTNIADGKTTTYTRREMCGGLANSTGWFAPGTLNFVYITVPRGRRIFYQYGVVMGITKRYSATFSFTSPPLHGPTSSVNLIWTADYGQAPADRGMQFGGETTTGHTQATPPSPGRAADPTNVAYWLGETVKLLAGRTPTQGSSANTARQLRTEVLASNKTYHAMFISGDISYARGTLVQWEQFFLQNTDVFRRVPLLVGMGNHERNWMGTGGRFVTVPKLDVDSGGECGVPTLRRFISPPPFTPPGGPAPQALPDSPWYSVDIGPVHYIQYSSEHDVLPGSPQFLFIANDLARVNRKVTPWVVVGGHRPMHASSIQGVLPTSTLLVGQVALQAFEDLFFIHEVDLVLHGHDHTYQRTHPVYKRRRVDGAPVYVVAGTAGYELTVLFQAKQADYFDVIYLAHGYLRFSANMTSFVGEFVSSDDRSVLDTFSFTKPADYMPDPVARIATVTSYAGKYDNYETDLVTNFSIAHLQAFDTLILPNLTPNIIGSALTKFAKEQGSAVLGAILTANADAPTSRQLMLPLWMFAVDYLLPEVAKQVPAVNASDEYWQIYLPMTANVAFAKSLAERGRSIFTLGEQGRM